MKIFCNEDTVVIHLYYKTKDVYIAHTRCKKYLKGFSELGGYIERIDFKSYNKEGLFQMLEENEHSSV